MVPERWSDCDRHNFFVILGKFLPFYPTNNLQDQDFEKMFSFFQNIDFADC